MIAIVALLGSLVAAAPALTPAPRTEAILGVSGELVFRRMAAVVDGERSGQFRPIGIPFAVEVGAQVHYRRGEHFGSNGWRGVFTLGTGPVLPTGGFALALGHQSLREFGRRPGVRFATGVGVSLAVDLPHARLPFGQVGVPVVLSTRRVDVWWMPAISFPLAIERFEFLGGSGWRGVAVMIVPLNLGVRFKLGPRHRRVTPAGDANIRVMRRSASSPSTH